MSDAPDLGLPPDCSQIELIRKYRHETVRLARRQLEQMIRDLASTPAERDTLQRLVELARTAQVHPTSASAYIKLKRIAPLRKDYGIEDPRDTGIPEVHAHLRRIAREAGVVPTADTALLRLDKLHEEMALFFRSRADTVRPETAQARQRIASELTRFDQKIEEIRGHANDRLRLYREQFHHILEPLLGKSVQGVEQSAEGWGVTHWATLRAIVHRDGCFRSPSTGRSFDFNEDLAKPLLEQLPVSWEKYFTDDLGRVIEQCVLQVKAAGNDFCDRISLIAELLLNTPSEGMNKQLTWFGEKVGILAAGTQEKVLAGVRERRAELAASMPLVAKGKMQVAYDCSKQESGPGIKRRILGHLQPVARASARPIYSTIQSDLLEGLQGLELLITSLFTELNNAALGQAKIVANNANIDTDEHGKEPVVAEVLKLLGDPILQLPRGTYGSGRQEETH